MAIPTVTNFDITKIPVEGTSEFRANASYVWSTIPNVITGFNSAIAEINKASISINNSKNTTVSANTEAQLAAVIAKGSANFKGLFSLLNYYKVGDTVIYKNVMYLALQDVNNIMPTNTQYWKVHASIGSVGDVSNTFLHLPFKRDILPLVGGGSCTFSRATPATYINRYGKRVLVDIDTVRYDKDGILLEGGSQNYVDYSTSLDWTPKNLIVELNTLDTIALDGTNTATKLTPTGANDPYFSKYIVMDGNSLLGKVVTFSIDVWCDEGMPTNCMLFLYADSTTETGFNKLIDISITPTRYYFSREITADKTGCIIRFDPPEVIAGFTGSYYVQAAQLEYGGKATSYIDNPTTTLNSRAPDVLYFTSNDSIPLLKDGFTIIVDIKLTSFGELDTTNQLAFYFDNLSTLLFNAVNADNRNVLAVGNKSLSVIDNIFDTGKVRIAISYDKEYLSLFANGNIVATTQLLSTDIPDTTIQTIIFNEFNEFNGGLCGTISNFKIYDKPLDAYSIAIA